jgi:hypothetical protein
MIGIPLDNLFRQFFTHFETRIVDTNAIHDGIGSSKVDILKYTGTEFGIWMTNARMTVSCIHVDKNGFPWANVTGYGEIEKRVSHNNKEREHT